MTVTENNATLLRRIVLTEAKHTFFQNSYKIVSAALLVLAEISYIFLCLYTGRWMVELFNSSNGLINSCVFGLTTGAVGGIFNTIFCTQISSFWPIALEIMMEIKT